MIIIPGDRDKIFERYGDGSQEDGRAESSRTSSLEFYYTKKHIDEYVTRDCRVLEVGCATGHYGLYYADKCREYVGVDVFPPHIDFFRRKIKELELANVSCQVGDAADLTGIADDSFDVVLCLGPMYHLPKEERELVFSECRRVCKTGGVLAFAYINKVGVYCGACLYDDWRDIYPNRKSNEYVFEKGTDDERPGLFYFTMPEEMEEAALRHGLMKLKNLGTDFTVTRGIVDVMDDEKFEVMKELLDCMSSYESCTGMSGHAVLVCRK